MKSGICHCIALRRMNKIVTDYYDRVLASCGVTINQFFLLRSLEKLDNPSVSELALKMRLDRSTLVRALRPLVASGLIEDQAAQGTRNRSLVLTKKGNKTLLKGGALWDEAQRGVEEKLGAGDLAALHSMLVKLQGL